MSISLRVLVQCTWFNVRLKKYHQAVRTHYQRDSYDIFSWLYTFMIRGCFLYLGTVYIGWKTIEISKTINVMKIVLASFLFIFSYWCVGRLWFFYWRNDWNQEYLSNKYLEHLCEVYRKFFRGLWKQQTSFSWNRESLSECSNPIFNGIFS